MMNHRFLRYDRVRLDDPDLDAIESHANRVMAGEATDLIPPLPEDSERAEVLLREWYAILDDLICARDTLADLAASRASSPSPNTDRIAFRVRQGIVQFTGWRRWSTRLAPAFRSDGSAIIFSDILPLDGAYALVELRGSDRGPLLVVEGGGKNQNKFHISLYTRGIAVEKSLLGTKISWDLSSCEPGHYQLKCNNTSTLSFQIQE